MSLLFKEGRHGMIARDHEGGAEGGVENDVQDVEVQQQVDSLLVHIRFIALFHSL